MECLPGGGVGGGDGDRRAPVFRTARLGGAVGAGAGAASARLALH